MYDGVGLKPSLSQVPDWGTIRSSRSQEYGMRRASGAEMSSTEYLSANHEAIDTEGRLECHTSIGGVINDKPTH